MAVYPDKKAGKLNGRWRVEIQKGKDRYRARHNTHALAMADDARAKRHWTAGEGFRGIVKHQELALMYTVATLTELASEQLWEGTTNVKPAWAHIAMIGDIIGQDTRLDTVTTQTIDKIIVELKKRGKKDATINRYLSHFRTFLKWGRGRGYVTTPEASIVFQWRTEKKGRIRWLSPQEEVELQKLLPRNVWMLVKVAIETGCRRAELLNAQLKDIDGNLLSLWDTKTDKPRTIPMGPKTTEMLRELITKKIMPTARVLRYHWELARFDMNLTDDKDFVFHACRHTRATRLLDAGVNVFVIQEWLGHSQIETTKRYTHVKPQNLVEALARVGGF